MKGIAAARKGSGVYVRDFRPVVRDGIARLGGTWAQGRSIWSSDIDNRVLKVDQIYVGREEPPDRVRIILELGDNDHEVVVRRRRFVLDGKPVLQSVSYLPTDIASGSRIEQEDRPRWDLRQACRARSRAGPFPGGSPLPDAGAR